MWVNMRVWRGIKALILWSVHLGINWYTWLHINVFTLVLTEYSEIPFCLFVLQNLPCCSMDPWRVLYRVRRYSERHDANQTITWRRKCLEFFLFVWSVCSKISTETFRGILLHYITAYIKMVVFRAHLWEKSIGACLPFLLFVFTGCPSFFALGITIFKCKY